MHIIIALLAVVDFHFLTYFNLMSFDFKKLLYARFLFTFAVQMQAVILGWRIYEILQDPLALGLIGLAEAIPAIGLSLYAGYIVDKSRPLKA